MKSILTSVLVGTMLATFAQAVPPAVPIEERHPISYWWWVLGVLIAIGAGIGVYMLIKKDPKRDAVR